MDEELIQISNSKLEDDHASSDHLQPAEKSNHEYESDSSDLNPVTTDDQQDETSFTNSTARSYTMQTTPLSTQTDQHCLPSHPWEADNGVSWTGGGGLGGSDDHVAHNEIDISVQNPGEESSSLNSGIDNQISAGRKRKVVQKNQRIVKSKVSCLPACNEEKIKLKKGDNIVIELEGETIQAEVTGRDKVTGKFYNYFNIKGARGLAWNVNLEQAEWRLPESEEDCLFVMIPKHRHGEKDCRDAKKTELEKLKNFDTVTEVQDSSQFRISSTWVLWVKEMPGGALEVRARLVARGYEEQEEVISDSPTVDQVNIKILLAIAASNGWKVVSSDVNTAFLQG